MQKFQPIEVVPPNIDRLGTKESNKRAIQGNLKGESVVAAILPSRMETSYCTSGFFCSYKARQIIS